MRELVMRFGSVEERVIREYAVAEEGGEVERKSSSHGISAEQYTRALWNDAIKKVWVGGVR